MIASSFFYAITFVTVRELAATFSVFQITFFRAVLGVIVMLPWLARAGVPALRTTRWRLYALRAIVTYTGMVCWFYGLKMLPLADATAIAFTAPLLAVVFLSFWIGERVGFARWIAIVVGFAGALVVIRPGVAALSLAAMGLLYTAVSYGFSSASTRVLATTENSNAVVFYMFATVLPLSIGPAFANWTMPGWVDAPLILLFGALSLVSMLCMTRSLAAAPGYVVMPMFYLQLPFVATLGLVLFDERTSLWTWVGAAVICASGYAIVWIEGRRKRAR
jgi:drug/metabolite transporter (DMT)-like permease